MADKSDLQFLDSGQDDVLFDKADSQTHTFTNFPTSAVDEDEEDDADKSQLLKDDTKKSPSFWTFEYYQQFFDVETHQVFHRVVGSMVPIPYKNYLQSHIRPTPDLYGPFWICATLVFTTAIAGNLANYLSAGGKDFQWKYDFHKVTFAATAIFSYWWLIPALLYGTLLWRKSQAGYTFLEILCLYGYSLAIYIPISVLWVINYTWLRWILVIVGALLSGGVLVFSVWPSVKDDTRKIAVTITALVFIFHLLLATGFVLYFFNTATATTPIHTTTTAVPITTPKHVEHGAVNLKGNPIPAEIPSQKAKTPTGDTGGGSDTGGTTDTNTGAAKPKKPNAEEDLSGLTNKDTGNTGDDVLGDKTTPKTTQKLRRLIRHSKDQIKSV